MKSVQRGCLKLKIQSNGVGSVQQTINIAPVDTSKSLLLVNLSPIGTNTDSMDNKYNFQNRSVSLESDKIVFTFNRDATGTAYWWADPVYWQVVEFY